MDQPIPRDVRLCYWLDAEPACREERSHRKKGSDIERLATAGRLMRGLALLKLVMTTKAVHE